MKHPSSRIYRVFQGDKVLMTGTLAQCYEAYPTLATVEPGKMTKRGIWLELIEWPQ